VWSLSDPEFGSVVGLPKTTLDWFMQKRTKEKRKPGHSYLLSPFAECLMLILYLKHALTDALLAACFKISRTCAMET